MLLIRGEWPGVACGLCETVNRATGLIITPRGALDETHRADGRRGHSGRRGPPWARGGVRGEATRCYRSAPRGSLSPARHPAPPMVRAALATAQGSRCSRRLVEPRPPAGDDHVVPQAGFRLIGEAGFEPATARPPAGGHDCHMRPDASHASHRRRDASHRSDDASGTKAVPGPRWRCSGKRRGETAVESSETWLRRHRRMAGVAPVEVSRPNQWVIDASADL